MEKYTVVKGLLEKIYLLSSELFEIERLYLNKSGRRNFY